jgi:RNA polymerase sigma factor (sigma-70 family)
MLKANGDRARLSAMWSKLPGRDRLIFTLLYFEGLTVVEAARAVGCSVREVERTVETRLAKLSRILALAPRRRAVTREMRRQAA